ncbi:TlpA family protein disulfide reductase [Marinilabilia rubra]|uniref:Redoxin n=1 Tax=Marinilabilia rubra TaxID=2162893 RepID=A0A2U2BDU9_9BACT|nr:TlpA disulfide reductase family protein [Marinilabilia rubra]PWE01239.1 redoxin [Marinilabilia rubra]
MHLFKYLFAIMIISGLTACQSKNESRGYIVEVGEKAPVFKTTLTNGEEFNLQEKKGKVVLLQFTASWCGVCRKEMPHIEKEIWQKHKENGLIVIGIDRDEPLKTVKEFAKQTGITYPLALDPGAEIFSLYAEKEAGVTRNVLIDREGKIVFLTRLFNEKEFSSLVERIDELMQ